MRLAEHAGFNLEEDVPLMKNILAALVSGSQVISPTPWKFLYGFGGYSRQGKFLTWLRAKRIAFDANPRGQDLDVGLI
jgi:hypothetical protein